MPTLTHPTADEPRSLAGELLQEAFAEAVTASKRYARLARTTYYQLEQDDTSAAREAHARVMYGELALAALRAAHGDEAARAICRALLGQVR